MKKILTLLIATLFCTLASAQEPVTGLAGKVVDAETGESVPFVQIVFEGTTIGTTTDMEGNFRVENREGHTKLLFRMMGYEPVDMTLERGRMQTKAKVTMTAQAKLLGAVEVKARRGRKTRYTRRNNPAVELARKVIEHKDINRLESVDRYRRDVYEKLTLALDDFHPDWEKNKWWRKLNFLEKYVDVTPYDATPILTISMREKMMQQSYRRRPRQRRTLTTAYRMEGLDQILGQEGIDADLSAMFTPIDIYDSDIELMLNHFVSPLSKELAISFYKYYITDTTWVDDRQCIELSFVPVNKESYGFTGQLYVALDSTYALVKYVMTVSPNVNLNFVRDLTIIQTYCESDNGKLLPDRCDTYGRMYIHKRLQEVYAHQVRLYTDYDISSTAELLPDSLFTPLNNTATLPGANKMRRREWNRRRPMELTAKETVLDSLKIELARLPEFQALKKAAEIGISGYVPTHRSRQQSYFDIGPIYNIASYNHEEGFRLRLGGMTTARISPRNFAECYAAYGFRDRRAKFNATLIHTFDDKEHHSHEAPMSQLSLTASYEMETPGQGFDNFDRDNMLMSTDIPHKVQYVGQAVLRCRKEWRSHINIDTWLAARQYEPAGTLTYMQIQPDGSTMAVDRFAEAEWMGKLSFTPNRANDSRRPGGANLLNIVKDAPNISISHRIGLMEGGFFYQRTDFAAEKRFWLGAFGHIDAKLRSGVVWNRVPYPRLYIPNGNSSLFLSSSSFNSMQPMEFIMDQYVALNATYHLKGWILNRIPLINRLRLREVVGFNVLYGRLSAKNDPSSDANAGLFVLPEQTRAIGTEPYMEYSVGIENILKFIRIDYVRRLTYIDHLAPKERGFIRMELRFTL